MLNEVGYFRGTVADWGVTTSTNGYPQFVVELRAEQYYDEGEGIWSPVDEVDTITAYQVLFGGNGKATLNNKQIQKVFGWSGASFKDLALSDYSETKVQFRTEEEIYNNETSIQVGWIDEYDAKPGRKVSKLDEDDLAKLDAQYSKQLKNTATKKPTKSTKTKTKIKTKTKKSSDRPKKSKKKKDDDIGGRCTADDAWEEVADESMRKEGLSEEDVGVIFLEVVTEVLGEKDEDDATPEEWFKIKEKAKDKVYKF